MTSLQEAVSARLAAQPGQEEAAALWKELWAAFETGGAEGAQECLSELMTDPQDEEETDEE